MKNNNYEYTADCDVNSLLFDLHNAKINFIPTQENSLKIICENDKGLHISIDEGVLTLKKATRSRLFSKRRDNVNVFVPDHTVPDVTVCGKDFAVGISGGIYARFSLTSDNCSVDLEGCSFTSCSLTGENLSTFLSGVTVKNTLVVKCGTGDMIWENSFAASTECRVKRGNIGLSAFNCKNSILEAENGNVAARLNGSEIDYSLGLLIKEGTTNKESVQREGAARSFKAYSAKGNIAIDFMSEDVSRSVGDMN